MITIDKIGGQQITKSAEFKGLSTDIKPTNGVPNGSTFYEMDKQDLYMYDLQNDIWIKQ